MLNVESEKAVVKKFRKEMKKIKYLERLKRIHELIKSENTGTPKEFAYKLHLSESQLYNILEDLKIKGFPIIYSRSLKTYSYNDTCELEVIYFVQLLTSSEKIKIAGGSLKSCFTPMQLECADLNLHYQNTNVAQY